MEGGAGNVQPPGKPHPAFFSDMVICSFRSFDYLDKSLWTKNAVGRFVIVKRSESDCRVYNVYQI